MYCILGLRTSHLLHILSSICHFFSFHTLNDDFFVKGFCGTLQFKIVILGMLVDDDVLYFTPPFNSSWDLCCLMTALVASHCLF